MKRRSMTPRALLAATLVVAALTAACAGNKAPDATVAHYGGTVIGAITELQKGVTAATDSGALPVETARQVTTQVERARDAAARLGTALQAYHAAATLDLRKLSAAEIQTQLAAVSEAVGAILKVSVSGSAATQVTTLIGNVIQAVSAVQAEVAKGLGQ